MRITIGRALLAPAMIATLVACSSPTVVDETAQEEANKQVVLDFYEALNDADDAGAMAQRIPQIAETYLHPDYTQRAGAFVNLPGEGSDRDKLVQMFQSMPPMPTNAGAPAPRPTTISVMSEGDLVMLLTKREATDPASGQPSETFIFNMFRVEDGQLIEHWDTSQQGGPPPGAPPGAGGPPEAGPPGPPAGSQ